MEVQFILTTNTMPNIAIFARPVTDTIPANAVYASPSGVSTNPGTEASPKDLASAYTATPVGGTLVLSGTATTPYRTSLEVAKRINIVAKPGSTPVISGANVISSGQFVLESNGNYYKDAFTPAYPPVDPIYVDPAYPQAANCQQVFVDGIQYKQVKTKAELTTNTFFVQASPARLYIKGSPAGKTVEVSVRDEVLKVTSGASGGRISGIVIAHGGNYNIYHTASNFTYNKVNSFYGGFRATQMHSGANIKMLDCGHYYAGSTGMSVREGIKDFDVIGGDVVGCNTANFAKFYGASGIKQLNTCRTIELMPRQGITNYEGINIKDNNCHGIWLDSTVNNARIHKCIVSGNSAGIMVEISFGDYVVNNIVFNNDYGIFIVNAKRNVVANNTTVLNNKNIFIRGYNRTNPSAEQAAAGYDWKTEDNRVYNNIMDRSRGTSPLYNSTIINLSTVAISESRNNAYNRQSATQPADILSWRATSGYVGYSDLNEFRADYPGYEAGSIGRTGVTTATSHPFFSDASNYTVKAGSPTIGAGKAVSGVVAELLGVADNTVVNIGAYITLTGEVDPITPPPACSVEISEATEELQSRVQQLNDDLNAANVRIEQLESSTNQQAEIDSLRSQVNTLTNQKATLEAQLTAANNTLAFVTGERDAANSIITQKTSRISELEIKLAEVKTQLTTTLNYIG